MTDGMTDVQQRAVAGMTTLAAVHHGECIVLVSHADIIRSIVLRVLGVPLDAILRIEVEPASVCHLQIDGPAARLLSLNAHLPVPEFVIQP